VTAYLGAFGTEHGHNMRFSEAPILDASWIRFPRRIRYNAAYSLDIIKRVQAARRMRQISHDPAR
jgi:hypothetical protein